jgi:hypothetical protein
LRIVNQIGHSKLEIAAQRCCHLGLLGFVSPPEGGRRAVQNCSDGGFSPARLRCSGQPVRKI